MPEISIIVPVYNVEKYLKRCIDSILSQTFTDFELILVDDGSPDGCPAICDEYAQQDSRIRVIHKENGGLSDARNAGLEVAIGKFIGFVDSDDFIHPQMYALLYDAAIMYNAGIVQCEFNRFYEDREIAPFHEETLRTVRIMGQEEYLDNFYPENCYAITSTVCNKLYKCHIFQNIRFPFGQYYEDGFVLLETLNCCSTECEKVILLQNQLYWYMQREGSIMYSAYSSKWFQGTNNNKNNLSFFRKKNNRQMVCYALDDYLTRFCKDKLCVEMLHRELKTDFRETQRAFLKEIVPILQVPIICKMKKLMMLLLFISPKSAYSVCKKYFPECLFPFMRQKDFIES
ncbi:MAG: glycosyltransferase family 2 protein [Eubacteriales bacterium]